MMTVMSNRSFNTGEPIAYFITWTTYGTWLPGEERGWRRRGEADIQPPNVLFEQMNAADMKEAAFNTKIGESRAVYLPKPGDPKAAAWSRFIALELVLADMLQMSEVMAEYGIKSGRHNPFR